MKLAPPVHRKAYSTLRLACVIAGAALVPLLLHASAPSWWSQRGVIIQNLAPDDYAPANQGQVKNIAKAAIAEMDEKLPGGAGSDLHELIKNWSTSTPDRNDFAPINVGQLKEVAKPFYDRLIAVGLRVQYPWTNALNQSDDFALANIGQVKNLFSFELPAVDPLYDGDHNGLPDQWEWQYFGAIGVDPNADPDGDGISNGQEYLNGTDPTDFFNDTLRGLSVISGADQRGNPGALLPVPISVRVSSLYSYGVPDAPVTFVIAQGSARLVPNQVGTSAPSSELTVRADAYDSDGYPVAQVYILLPSTPDVSVIRASVHGGVRSFSVTAIAVAIDPYLLAPSNLAVIATSPSSARLTWMPADSTFATTVQVSIDGGITWITLGTVAPGVTQASVTGLAPDQAASFRVYSGGTPSGGDTSSFTLPDLSAGPPLPPPGPGGGTTTEPVDVKPLGAPVLEIETASMSRAKFGFPGLLNQGGPYRDETVVITSNYTRGDGTPDPYTGTTTVRHHWQRSDDGGQIYTIDTTEVTGGGGYLNSPWTTVTNTDTVFRQEGAPFYGYSGGSSRTITLSNLYTDAEINAEANSLVPSFYDEFWPARNDAYSYLSRGPGGISIQFLQYRFKTNADPNLVVTWDVQFTPQYGGPVQHDIQSWSANGSTQSPTYLLDPRTLNGGQNGTYRILLVSAELMVDGNRDGEISFDDSEVHAKDQTTAQKAYRFWLNDDDDGAPGDPGDHVPITTPDYTDGIIRSPRDLEDFSRLHLRLHGLEKLLESGSITAAFEWRQESGTPKVKLYRAVSEGTEYLTNPSIAISSTLSPFRETLGEVGPGTPLFVPQSFWVSASPYANVPSTLPVSWFLFEGSGEGTGQLILSFWKDGHRVGTSGGAWIDLKNIKTMYQHQVLGGPDPWIGQQFQPAVDEQKEVIVFVHGWRLSPSDTANFAETMFKRIWWRGFKGRFAAVRWDTFYNASDHGWVPYAGQAIDAYLGKYNDSEHNAWLTGQALKGFVDAGLPLDYSKYVVAHSMGNVVTGAALQQGMTVDKYALLNAALPAACYDEDPNLKQAPSTTTASGVTIHLWDQETPDDDSDPPTRAMAYRSRLKNVGGNLISFYLPRDYATSYAWELNNALTKPPAAPLSGPFLYKRDFTSGQKLIKGIDDPATGEVAVDHYITDPNEAEPYACRTWGKAVGAESRTHGKLNGAGVNLDASFNLDQEHSGEFNREIQTLVPFYRELLRQLNIPQDL